MLGIFHVLSALQNAKLARTKIHAVPVKTLSSITILRTHYVLIARSSTVSNVLIPLIVHPAHKIMFY